MDKYLRHFIFHSVIFATIFFYENKTKQNKKQHNETNLVGFSLGINKEFRSDCIHHILHIIDNKHKNMKKIRA